ncbi:MAG: type IV pilus assembly protein PilM, partial [Patescibacteria group bacterium]
SDISVKVLEIEKLGDEHRIRSFFEEAIPQGAIENGVIVRKDLVAEAIKKAVRSARPKRINTRKAVCSLPESKAFLRIISIPDIKEEEAGEAVKWEIEASIPLSVDQVYFDWQFIDKPLAENKENSKKDVLTVAVAKEVVDEWMGVFSSAGLDVQALELESVATARGLIKKDVSLEEVSLIVDLGAKRTSFIITEGNIPFFTSSIPFSSENLTDAISKYLNISLKEAERLKITQGLSGPDGDDVVFKAVGPSLDFLIGEIEKTIDFYSNMDKGNKNITRVILCGGGANLKGMVPYLAKKIDKDFEEGDPWLNLNFSGNLPPISKEESTGYATVVGLAIRSLEDGNQT